MYRVMVCLALGATLVGPTATRAGDGPYRGRGDGTGWVTAESRYGSQTISGPVRRAGNAYEVRLPGGTWIDCHLCCSEALRRETIDFWQNHSGRGNGEPGDGTGYFLWRR